MELLQLKYFCESAKTQNFSKTASKFGVPPSNISQSIKRLESELGTKLFIRKPNRILLSERGAAFYKSVTKALEIINDATMLARDNGSRGKISLSINATRRTVMEAVEEYKRVYPDVIIKIAHFGNPDTDDFDIIIDDDIESLDGYRKVKMMSESIALAMNKSSPIASIENISIEDLKDVPFITFYEKSSLYRHTKSICAHHGFNPRIAIQSDDPFYVRKCVELGLGISFVPTISWQGQFGDDIILRDTGYTRDTFIYIKEDEYAPICITNFFNMLQDMVKKKYFQNKND